MGMALKLGATVALLGLLSGREVGAQEAEPHPLSWLAGCWELKNGDRLIEEHWMAPRGGLMLGMARTLRAGKLASYEQTLIRRGPDGRLVFVASVPGQAPTTFTAAGESDTAIAFRNMEHDFPKEVRYARRGADSLLASIAGDTVPGARRIGYPYRRVGCRE